MPRKLLIPEVVQTSAMDCGPASLRCLLAGFGIAVNYGRLRDACQTSVDGASIDTIEQLANQLGLLAEQVILPPSHILLPEAQALPAIAIVRSNEGLTHFVVVWRCHYGLVQLMDPAVGRRWVPARQFLNSLYIHTMAVGAADWRNWAESSEAVECLLRRLLDLRIPRDRSEALLHIALADAGWRSVAALFAVAGLMESLVGSGVPFTKRERSRIVKSLFEAASCADGERSVPRQYWPVTAISDGDDQEQLLLSGAVLIRVKARRTESAETEERGIAEDHPPDVMLSPHTITAIKRPQAEATRELLRLILADGLLAPGAVIGAMLLAALIVVGEAVLFRSLLDIGANLYLTSQRIGAVAILLIILSLALLLSVPIASEMLRQGRHLETRLRIAVLRKIRRLDDRYFRSRPVSDSAERSHSVHGLRRLPLGASQALASIFQLIFTTVGIIWLAPASAALTVLVAALNLALPLILQPALAERDLRVRNHGGALSRFYLDAMLGLIPVRAHGAERAVSHEHERLLFAWARAGLGMQRLAVVIDSVQFAAGFGLVIWLLLFNIARPAETGSLLLLIFWVLNLPALGQAIAMGVRQYPMHRNVTLRLLDPLLAPETETATLDGQDVSRNTSESTTVVMSGVGLQFENISLTIAGHPILRQLNLEIKSGSHIAIVGPSGAGKSSLVSLLLGWNTPSAGKILVDGVPLQGERLARLREETAWIDPSVQLWNRSLAENLCYGASCASAAQLGQMVGQLELRQLLESLSQGLQTPLGESGALLSGGEGQRVRLGRAMMRGDSRLVIMDEPFGGLDRPQRRRLLRRARQLWRDASLIYVTHDISEVRDFERVVVLEAGNIIEDGPPGVLSRNPESRLRALQRYDAAIRKTLMSSAVWRRLYLKERKLSESARTSSMIEDGRGRTALDKTSPGQSRERTGS